MICKDKVVDRLFSLCSDRSVNSKEVTKKLCEEFKVEITTDIEDTIRRYKSKGTGLDKAASELRFLLEKQLDSKSQCNGNCDDDCDSC